MSRWLAIASAVALALSGCAGPGVDSPEARQVKAKDDPFQPYRETVGATLRIGGGIEAQTLTLVARRDRQSGVLTTHARVLLRYVQKTGRRYETARNEKAEMLPLRHISHDNSGCRRDEGCPHVEELFIDLPEPQLRAARQTGYKFKVYAKTGQEALFPVPPQLIGALLDSAGAGDGGPGGAGPGSVAASAKPKPM